MTIQSVEVKPASKRIRQVVLSLSHSNTFEEACQEWAVVDILKDGDSEFVSHCELCGSVFHKTNFIIHNQSNNNKLKVGSECIKRFSGLKGVSSQGDIGTVLKRVKSSLNQIWKMQALLPCILDMPTRGELLHFNSLCRKFIEYSNGGCSLYKLDELKDKLLGKNYRAEVYERLHKAIFNPHLVPILRGSIKQTKISEYASQNMKVKTRVRITNSRYK